MASPTAPSTDRFEETTATSPTSAPTRICRRSRSSTDRRSPPDTRSSSGSSRCVGAVAWAVIAFFRGETVNAVWFVIAAICTYVIGFRFYARLIEMKIVRPRDDNATPAELFENATDYMPTDRRVLFGHHFAAIAGAGPLVGPVLAMQMGYLPGTIWIIIGAVFAGCVQDYLVLAISTRRRGRSLGQMARDELGRDRRRGRHRRRARHHGDPAGGAGAGGGRALAESPWGVFSIAMTIPDRDLHGSVPAVPAPRPGVRGVADRCRPAAARRGIRRLGRRNRLGR